MSLKHSGTRYKQKTNIFLQLYFYFWLILKELKRDKSQFVTKFLGIKVTIIFI